MLSVSRDRVLRLYDEGVGAFAESTKELDSDGWARAACGEWTAAELARHALAVVGWYHAWLDQAQKGDAVPPFGVAELGARNAEAVGSMAGLAGGAPPPLFLHT